MSWSCGICSLITSCPYISASIGLLSVGLLGYLYLVHERVPTWNLKGSRVLLTGGSSGIGLCLAQQLVQHGAIVTIVARDEKKLKAAIDTVRSSTPSAEIYSISADISDNNAIVAAVQQAQANMKGLDVVIANAGVTNPGFFTDLPISEFQRINNINYLGNVYLLKACVPYLKKQSRGRIVIVSSMAGLLGVAGYTAYSPSKFALRGLAEALHMELKPYNIAVTVVNPPDVDTPCYEEENKSKPLECTLISEGSGVFKPQDIAKDIINGIIHWKFMINSGFDGFLTGLFVSGCAPSASIGHSLLEFMFGGLFRIVWLGYRYSFNRIVERVHADRMSGKITTVTGQPEESKKSK